MAKQMTPAAPPAKDDSELYKLLGVLINRPAPEQPKPDDTATKALLSFLEKQNDRLAAEIKEIRSNPAVAANNPATPNPENGKTLSSVNLFVEVFAEKTGSQPWWAAPLEKLMEGVGEAIPGVVEMMKSGQQQQQRASAPNAWTPQLPAATPGPQHTQPQQQQPAPVNTQPQAQQPAPEQPNLTDEQRAFMEICRKWGMFVVQIAPQMIENFKHPDGFGGLDFRDWFLEWHGMLSWSNMRREIGPAVLGQMIGDHPQLSLEIFPEEAKNGFCQQFFALPEEDQEEQTPGDGVIEIKGEVMRHDGLASPLPGAPRQGGSTRQSARVVCIHCGNVYSYPGFDGKNMDLQCLQTGCDGGWNHVWDLAAKTNNALKACGSEEAVAKYFGGRVIPSTVESTTPDSSTAPPEAKGEAMRHDGLASPLLGAPREDESARQGGPVEDIEVKQANFEGWAIVEMMGHRKEIGYVTTQAFGQAILFRVDVPELPEREFVLRAPEYANTSPDSRSWCPAGTKVKRTASPARSCLVAPASLYALNPCSPEAARTAIERNIARPLIVLELPVRALESAPPQFACCNGNLEDGHDLSCENFDEGETPDVERTLADTETD